MIDYILEIDKDLFIFLNGLGTKSFDWFWLMVTSKISNIILYLFLSFIYFQKTNLKQLVFLLLTLALMILFTDQATNLFKYTFSRLRPCHNENLDLVIRLLKSNCGGLYGYFSAHASNSFALAVFFLMLFINKLNKAPILLLIFASLVSYSRIYIGVHYPLDVVSGAFFGCMSGYLFYFISRKYT